MKKKVVWIAVSVVVVLGMLVAACAPAPEEKAPAPASPAAPAAPAAPAVKETAPAVKEAAPAEAEGMVKLTLTKTDGTKIEKLVEKPKYGGRLNTVLTASSAPQYWNGDKGTWPQLIYEDLMIWDWTKGPAGTEEWDGMYRFAIPWDQHAGLLAESWELTDPDTMVLHIRKGVHFQNKAPAFGREMDAYDVEFTLRRSWTVPTSFNAGAYRAIDYFPDASVEKAIIALDKWTLQIKSQPGRLGHVYEVGVFKEAPIAPVEVLKYDMEDWRNAGGTGPWILTDYVPQSSVTFQRNPDYWYKDPLFPENQLPYLDSLKELIIPDASTRMAAMRTAKIDILGSDTTAKGALTWEDATQLMKTDPELQYKRFTVSSAPALYMRVDKPELPTYDIRVRRALSMAIDNPAIAKDIYAGEAEVFSWPVDPNIKAYAGLFRPLEEYPQSVQKLFGYYPEEAKKLLTEAGYPNGFKAEIIATVDMVDILSVVAAYWKKNLNVELDIQVMTSAVVTSIRRYHTHKDMLGGTLHKGAEKLINARIGRDDQNCSRMSDPLTEETTWKALKSYFSDPPTYYKLFRDVYPHIWEQAWFIQFPDPYVYTFWQPWVKNFYGMNHVATFDDRYRILYIWLDQDIKEKITGKR